MKYLVRFSYFLALATNVQASEINDSHRSIFGQPLPPLAQSGSIYRSPIVEENPDPSLTCAAVIIALMNPRTSISTEAVESIPTANILSLYAEHLKMLSQSRFAQLGRRRPPPRLMAIRQIRQMIIRAEPVDIPHFKTSYSPESSVPGFDSMEDYIRSIMSRLFKHWMHSPEFRTLHSSWPNAKGQAGELNTRKISLLRVAQDVYQRLLEDYFYWMQEHFYLRKTPNDRDHSFRPNQDYIFRSDDREWVGRLSLNGTRIHFLSLVNPQSSFIVSLDKPTTIAPTLKASKSKLTLLIGETKRVFQLQKNEALE